MRRPHSTAYRVVALAATIAIGVLAGTIGYLFTGNQAWFLAVPAALAGVWLYIADPSRCLPSTKEGEPSHHSENNAA
jgi:hypothetical protein